MKHKYSEKLISIFLLSVMVFLLTGCSKTTDFFSYQNDSQVKYKVAEKAYLAMGRLKTMNPVLSKDKDVYFINKLIYNSLFKLDESLLAQNDLAQSYVYDNGKKRITVKIKSTVKWSNGEYLTGDDVKFSIEAYKKAANSSLYASQVNNIDSISVDGDRVMIQFKSGHDMSLENLTFPIISKNQFRDINEAIKINEKYIPLGTGPYCVESYNPYSELRLKGNEFYAGDQPKNTLIFKVVPSDGETINLIEPNLISVAFSEKITRDVDFANLDTNINSYLSNEVEWVGFNLSKAPTNNKQFRQAIATAIDTKTIMETGYLGNGVLCDSIYYPGYWGIENTGSLFKYDRDSAVKLLKKSGYLDRNSDGLLEDKYGNKLSITILVNKDNNSRVTAAEIIKKSLDKMKIETKILSLEGANYTNAIMGRNFDIYIGGGKMGENYDLRSLLKSYNGNPAGYQNQTIDKYLNQIKSGISNEEKINSFKKLKAILADEIPYYPLVYKTYGVITSKAFNGTVKPVFNDIYVGAEEWTYNYEVQEAEEDQASTTDNII